MVTISRHFKPILAAALLGAAFSLPLPAQEAPEVDLDGLFAELADPDAANWQALERRIATEWSRSGSASMDLLLQRGREAIEAEEYTKAIQHLTALTDHAPDFAEGWNSRATAFFQSGRPGLAMQDIARALTLNPRHFGALTGLAVILQDLGYDQAALDAWRAVAELNPHRPETQRALERLDRRVGGQDI